MVHLRGDTHGGHWQGLVHLSVKVSSTEAADLDGSFLAEINNQHIGWNGAVINKVCVAFAPFVTSAVVTGGPGEQPNRKGEGSPEFVPAGAKVSKQAGKQQ